MKHIYVNLKRFDIPAEKYGVNRICDVSEWAKQIVSCKAIADCYDDQCTEFVMFLPEAHLLSGIANAKNSRQQIGAQGCYRLDVSAQGNFGAFTSHRPASILSSMGCTHVLIGHYEERKDRQEMFAMAGLQRDDLIDQICHEEIRAALQANLHVVYCIGEQAEEREQWKTILQRQITLGLQDLDITNIVLAYEPIWSIGPGKIPPHQAVIQERAAFIKKVSGGMDVVYGGGLKQENAGMLSEITEIDGGLIALTRFSGDIGFYREEYEDIVRRYLKGGCR